MFYIESDVCDKLIRSIYNNGYTLQNMTTEDKAHCFDIIKSEIDKIFTEEQDIRILRHKKHLKPYD